MARRGTSSEAPVPKAERQKLISALRKKSAAMQAATAQYLEHGRKAFEESEKRVISVVGVFPR
jgi:hypothetical protein